VTFEGETPVATAGTAAPLSWLIHCALDTIRAMGYEGLMRNYLLTLVCALASIQLFAAEAPATFKVSEFTFARPDKWEWQNTSPMRKAQLKVNSEDKKSSAEVVFFHFGQGQGGDTKANIDRWFSQFEGPREKLNPKTEEKSIAGRKVIYVHAEGTYLEGPPLGQKTPRAGYTLLGAILESEEGNVFVKFTGPSSLAKSSQADFQKMVEGALAKK